MEQGNGFDTLVYPSYRELNRFSQTVERQVEHWRQAVAAAEKTDVQLFQEARVTLEALYDADLKRRSPLKRKARMRCCDRDELSLPRNRFHGWTDERWARRHEGPAVERRCTSIR